MPIYPRENGFWYIDIVSEGGQRIRRSAGTKDKRQAQELHDKLKHELWRKEHLGEIPKRLWDEAAVRWIQEKGKKKSIKDDISRLRNLSELRGIYVHNINREVIMGLLNGKSCSDSTKNRYIALIRSILNACAKEWGWLAEAPKLKLYSEKSRKRIRWLKTEEVERLLPCLPDYMVPMVQFSLATGLRQYNVLTLSWDQIDLARRVAWYHPDETKSGEALGVALNDTAMQVLLQQLGKHPRRVFVHSRNRPLNSLNNKLWQAALAQAGIENFRWHDLRHTWASWLVQSGVSLYALKEMGGWESIEMVQKYAHLAPEHLHQHAVMIDDMMQKNSHNLDTLLNRDHALKCTAFNLNT